MNKRSCLTPPGAQACTKEKTHNSDLLLLLLLLCAHTTDLRCGYNHHTSNSQTNASAPATVRCPPGAA
jgi:hypothetical protein